MKLTIWAPDFNDLPTVKLTLPAKFGNKNVQLLYGYTQPSKPYDRTLFVQLILSNHATKRTLKSMTTQLKKIIKKSWDKSNYQIVKIDEEYKSGQSFSYFQLKRVHRALVRPGLLSTPLKVPKLKEPSKRKSSSKKKSTKKNSRKKTTRRKTTKKKTTRRKTSRSTKRKATKKKTTKRKTVRRTHSKTKRKTSRKKTARSTATRSRKKTSKKKSKRRR